MVHFPDTGRMPGGGFARSPMPRLRLFRENAKRRRTLPQIAGALPDENRTDQMTAVDLTKGHGLRTNVAVVSLG